MASTNKTTNYELSQYIGTDKPTYLIDYNQDMDKIDAGIHAAKSEADTNTSSIGTLSSLTTETKSSLVGAINEVDGHADTNAGNIATNTSNIATNTTHIGTLANLTTASKTDLVVAANEINAKVGDVGALTTTVKSSTVSAINEINSKLPDVYDDEEHLTNMIWFDKPVYRKILTLNNLPDTGSYQWNLGVANLDLVKINYGESYMTWTAPRTYSIMRDNPLIEFEIDGNKNLEVRTVDNSYINWIAYIVVEYTKTTD